MNRKNASRDFLPWPFQDVSANIDHPSLWGGNFALLEAFLG
jgi:hypothetical protein